MPPNARPFGENVKPSSAPGNARRPIGEVHARAGHDGLQHDAHLELRERHADAAARVPPPNGSHVHGSGFTPIQRSGSKCAGDGYALAFLPARSIEGVMRLPGGIVHGPSRNVFATCGRSPFALE